MFRLNFIRLYTTEVARAAYDKEALMRLRKMTGYSFQNCRRAVEKFGDDVEKAEKWLHETALKEGWSKLTAIRKAGNGAVGVLTDGKFGIMVEMNCETDFVARTDKFKGLVARVCHEAFKNQLSHVPPMRKPSDKWPVNVEAAKNIQIEVGSGEKSQSEIEHTTSLIDCIAATAGQLGEKIIFNRAVCVSAFKDASLFGYVHPRSAPVDDVLLGQFGTLLTLGAKNLAAAPIDDKENTNWATIGSMLCQHVIGMNPKTIGTFEKQSIDESQSNKSVDEPKKGEEAEVTVLSDETELLKQDFLIQPSLKVGEFLDSNNCKIYDFVRFKCGENDEK